ncbi:hypothetical protein ACSFC1_03365 [Pseudothermotoga sp. U03pept]|uniref:hypothetical protein n=1 Tax=Pseudothermotoga sp. U03pept TaxID=3447012 RepID=UPI003F0674B9
MVRDSYERGEEQERKIIELLKAKGMSAEKNYDKYDIYIIIRFAEGICILAEIEETSCRSWPSSSEKPLYPSKLFTMPIRKIKYFVGNAWALEEYLKVNRSIRSIEEFNQLFDKSTTFVPKNDGRIRLYIKGSCNLEHLCIVKSETIVKALNHNLADQDKVDKRIDDLKRQAKGLNFNFQGNIWENNEVKNFKGERREDPVTLVLGHIEEKNDLIWLKLDDLHKILCSIVGNNL